MTFKYLDKSIEHDDSVSTNRLSCDDLPLLAKSQVQNKNRMSNINIIMSRYAISQMDLNSNSQVNLHASSERAQQRFKKQTEYKNIATLNGRL